ncbi:MAG: DMT family transporter [Hyphomicrobiales bacterium]|nr:DMT family transporter [Hyphomicrobiales bacterium]
MPKQAPLLAASLIIAASILIAATTLLAKSLGTDALGENLHPLQITHSRFLFAWLGILAATAIMRPRFTRPNWGWHGARSACGFTGVSLMFTAVIYIPLADATAISFLNPVFAMLLAIPLLGERIGRWRILATLLAFAGALILTRPGQGTVEPAALLALAAAAVMGLELIFIKKLSGAERPLQILLLNNTIGLTIASSLVWPFFQWPNGDQWVALIALGLCMAAAQAFFVNGMARADASFVGPFSYSTLIFAAIYDMFIFDVVPDAVSLIGAATIMAGAILLAWREGVRRQQ